MYSLYGFIEIPNFQSNDADTIATIGELSAFGRTFSTEVGLYSLPAYENVQLISIDSRRDKALATVGLGYTDPVLHIAQWLYDRSMQGQLGQDPLVIKQALTAQFGASANITSVGPVVIQGGRYYFPSYITLNLTNTGESNELYIWFADTAFTSTYAYPGYEMRLINQVTPVDTLMGSAEAVLAVLKTITPATFTAALQSAMGQKPTTSAWSNEYTWHCLTNPDITYPFPLGALLNGVAGSNIDNILDFIRETFLANSQHAIADWRVVLPEVFRQTEFILVPLWDRKSLDNQDQSTRLYSPTSRAFGTKPYTDRYMPEFTADWLKQNLTTSMCIYKNLTFLACGNPDNYGAKFAFDEQFPKYAAISTLSPEFSKIPEYTRNFIVQMVALFTQAEIDNGKGILPAGLTRIERNGVIYVTFTYDSCQYLCPIRSGFMS